MFTEDLDTYFEDFGDSVVFLGKEYIGILDMPDQLIGDGHAVSTEYSLTVKTSDFPIVNHGDAITVKGEAYSVREIRKVDDGSLSKIHLQKE